MKKLISVVIPTFDRYESTIVAIQSIDCMDPEFVEIIVVDDCSKTPFIFLDEVNNNDIDVRVFALEKNSGPGLARKLGVENSKATYIAFLDSDDSFNSGWLNFLLLTLKLYPTSELYIAGIAEGGKGLGNQFTRLISKLPISIQTPTVRFVFMFFNPFYTPTLLINKKCCFFSSELRYCEDYYTNALGAFSSSKILVVSQIACQLGREPNSFGGESSNNTKMLEGEMAVRRSMFRSHLIPIYYKALVPFGVLYQCFRTLIKRIKNVYLFLLLKRS